MKSIVLGGGCFWCIEAYLSQFMGITSVIPGYAGGTSDTPSYELVCAGIGGHAEVVKVEFDESTLLLTTLLTVFWSIHDPTTLNRQGHDEGVQYRSCVYFTDTADETICLEVRDTMQKHWDNPIVTEILPLKQFYEAEDYHHNYFMNNPEKAYCQVVINPKLIGIRRQFSDLLV